MKDRREGGHVLKQLLTREFIQFRDKCEDWQEALDVVASPLLQNEKVNRDYVQTIAQAVQDGRADYIVLRPGFALPHARVEDGVYETAMSLLKLEQPVYFKDDETIPLYVIVMLAAVDAEEHLLTLSQLIDCIAEDADFDRVKAMAHKDELVAFIAAKGLNEKERR
jgi:PTS system ascorbate-specific IIA component